MARFMFVVPPLTGHVNPTIAVGRALMAAHHEVVWAGCASQVRPLLPEDCKLIELDETQVLAASSDWFAKAQTAFGLDSFKFFFEDFMIPLGHFMAPSVSKALSEFKPDLVIVDQQALAGSVLARKSGIPWVTFATTSASVLNPLEQFPKVKEWMTRKYAEFQEAYGVPLWERPDISDLSVFIFSARGLLPAEVHFPSHYHFVGPSLRGGTQDPPFFWERLDPSKKKIYVSLGTLNAERSEKFYQKVKEAFSHKEFQIIVSASPAVFGEIPDDFIVQKGVPQLALLKKVDAVLFHGGHNTFCEALNEGLPMVIAPIKDDQPVIAEQAVRAGVGLRVHFDRVKAPDLYQAVRRVLDEPKFVAAAKRIQEELASCGGALQAAHLIEGLVTVPGKPATLAPVQSQEVQT